MTSIPENRPCRVIRPASVVPYAQALRWQQELVGLRQSGQIPDTLLLLEHPPTITLGRGTQAADLLTGREELEGRGVTVVEVDRGGEITYHAPGQLVGYPILDLRRHGQDLHRYLRDLEAVLIQTVGAYGLAGTRLPGLTGVWVDGAKIAAIGIKVSRWVTMHGFALNVDLDLAPMRRDFVPCGIRDRGVTSMADQAPGAVPTRAGVEATLAAAFAGTFHLQMLPASETFPADSGIIGA